MTHTTTNIGPSIVGLANRLLEQEPNGLHIVQKQIQAAHTNIITLVNNIEIKGVCSKISYFHSDFTNDQL